MAFSVETQCRSEFECPLNLEQTYAFFSDFPTSVGKHFYGLKSFTPINQTNYRWIFNKLSYQGYELQIQFETRFVAEGKSKILIIPIATPDKASLQGHWEFNEKGNKTQVSFDAVLVGELPFPSFLKAAISPLAQTEVKKLFNRYIENVKNHLGA